MLKHSCVFIRLYKHDINMHTYIHAYVYLFDVTNIDDVELLGIAIDESAREHIHVNREHIHMKSEHIHMKSEHIHMNREHIHVNRDDVHVNHT